MACIWGEQAEAGEPFEMYAAEQGGFKGCFTKQTGSF